MRNAIRCLFMLSLLVQTATSGEPLNFFSSQVRLTMPDGLGLTGTWTLPAQSTPLMVAVIVQGSGNVGQDGDVSSPFVGRGYLNQPARLSQQMAEHLARAGVASLRFDKRGFEDSRELVHQTVPYLLQDLRAVMAHAHAQWSNLPLVLVGFSEGALLSALAVQPQPAAQIVTPVHALFLLGLPSRNIDELFDFQFIQWPMSLLAQRLDRDGDGVITGDEVAFAGPEFRLPALGAEPLQIDLNHDGVIDLSNEALPAYQGLRAQINDLAQTPGYAPWYHAMKQVPAWSTLARSLTLPVYAYHGALDSQVSVESVEGDLKGLTNLRSFRVYSELGHAFAPFEGTCGEIKTSGPFDVSLLSDLSRDLLDSRRNIGMTRSTREY